MWIQLLVLPLTNYGPSVSLGFLIYMLEITVPGGRSEYTIDLLQESAEHTTSRPVRSSACVVCSGAPTLGDPKDCSLPWNFPGKNTGAVVLSYSRGPLQTRD